jgi:hypothetical protein
MGAVGRAIRPSLRPPPLAQRAGERHVRAVGALARAETPRGGRLGRAEPVQAPRERDRGDDGVGERGDRAARRLLLALQDPVVRDERAVEARRRRDAAGRDRRVVRQVLWEPFSAAGRPEARRPEITEAIERLRPLASEALLATFKQTMAGEVERAFGKVLERQ